MRLQNLQSTYPAMDHMGPVQRMPRYQTLTPIQRAARHMRVEALGGYVLQVPTFDEVMDAVVERERRCRVRLLQNAPEAIRWWVGALQAAQDWLDEQPLRDVLSLEVVGALIEDRGTHCTINSTNMLGVYRNLDSWALARVAIATAWPHTQIWDAPLAVQIRLTNRVDR